MEVAIDALDKDLVIPLVARLMAEGKKAIPVLNVRCPRVRRCA